MVREEYIETIVIGDKCIPIGLNDTGQTYYFEYADNGELVEECCGSYNTDYKSYIEYKFGDPERDCPFYDNVDLIVSEGMNCPQRFTYGYCDKCMYQDRAWSNFQDLVKWGVVDRRGNINPKYSKYISKIEEESK